MVSKKKPTGPRVLLLDIETSPLLSYVWGLWENNVALNQIACDWYVLSWAAKWLDEPEVMQRDQRDAPNMEDDRRILRELWKLLDQADIIITQNGKRFDIKRLNARFIMHGFKPPSPVKHIDTLEIAKRTFDFTSNKLEYMTDKLNKKYKKLKHEEFAGFELWRQCLAGNRTAWRAMAKYNKYDVLALEELYYTLRPWDAKHPNFTLWREDEAHVCRCGSTEFTRRGYALTAKGKYQRYQCNHCGAWSKSGENLFSKEKRASIHTAS